MGCRDQSSLDPNLLLSICQPPLVSGRSKVTDTRRRNVRTIFGSCRLLSRLGLRSHLLISANNWGSGPDLSSPPPSTTAPPELQLSGTSIRNRLGIVNKKDPETDKGKQETKDYWCPKLHPHLHVHISLSPFKFGVRSREKKHYTHSTPLPNRRKVAATKRITYNSFFSAETAQRTSTRLPRPSRRTETYI